MNSQAFGCFWGNPPLFILVNFGSNGLKSKCLKYFIVSLADENQIMESSLCWQIMKLESSVK